MNLKELIRKNGVNKTAEMTGLDSSAVWRHMTGKRRELKVETLQRYAQAFNVDLTELIASVYRASENPSQPTSGS